MKTLLDAGLRLDRVRTAFEYIRSYGRDLRSAQMVIAGDSVILLGQDDSLTDIVARHRGQGVLNVLALDGLASEVEHAVRQLEND